jgi:chromosome segregation ATPase
MCEWCALAIRLLVDVRAEIREIDRKVDALMTQDASIAAEAAEIETDVQNQNQAVAALTAAFSVLEAEVAAGQPVSQATMDALSAAVSDLNTATASESALASEETSATTPTP